MRLSDCHYYWVSLEKPRQIAVRVLRRYAEQTDYLENLLEQEFAAASLAPSDRGLVQELTFGAVRWQATLDWLITQKTQGRPQKQALQILLRLGLYQMFWLDRIPDHAAVHETVEMAKQLGFGSQAGFVNAVLRGFLREREATENKLQELKETQLALGFSHPEWLCARWRERWDDARLRQLLEWNNTPPTTFARLNTLKGDPEQLAALWEKEEVHFFPRQFDWVKGDLVFELKSHPPLATLPSFQQGWFYIQDPSTLLAVAELNPQSGESILDLCSAPGGKTTYIAQLIKNQGLIVAQDPQAQRRELVRQNCERLRVTCVQLADSSPVEQTAPYDRILVDAPCSNTGVMRRRVDLRWRIRPEEITRLRATQLGLLQTAASQLKQGGTLVYSTCSLEPEENSQVIAEFLAAQKNFSLAAEQTLLPFVNKVDGAYVARLVLAS